MARHRTPTPQQLYSLVEHSEDLFSISDAEYRLIWANESYRKMYGLQSRQLGTLTLPEFLENDYFQQTVKPLLDRALAGKIVRYETDRLLPGLGQRKFLVRYYPLHQSAGEAPCVGTISSDVTLQRETEAELLHQATLLDMAGRTARFGGWLVDLESNHVEWSNMTAEIHGMPHGYSPTPAEGMAFYTPEYRKLIHERFKACAERGVHFDDEMQIIDAAGQRVWVRVMGEPVRDENGRITHLQGAFQDITSQREREQELHKLAQITQQSPAAIVVTDLNGQIEYVNAAFERVSGYSSDMLLGKSPAVIKGPDTPDSLHRDLWNTIKAGKTWTGELQNRHKDGSIFWESEVISPLLNEHGDIINYVAIKQDITALKQAEQELNQIAFEDLLTGLRSRLGFIRQLQQYLEQDGWHSAGIVLIIDIIGQRDVNDAYGYERGDQLLIEMGRRLLMQTDDSSLVGRIGGDEFILFLVPEPGIALVDRLSQLCDDLSAPFDLSGVSIEVNFRLGYTHLGEHQRSTEDLLREAERALFQHRKELSKPWVAYSNQLQEASQQRIALTHELRRALKEDELELHFQPKVDLLSGELVACEALLRWNHPERGLIPPGVFIPIAEQGQLIVPVGDWALRRACQHLRAWLDAGLQPVRVSVNVSVIQFQKGDFPSRVRAALEESGVAPQELALEVTESVFETESKSLLNQMRALRDMGVMLSLDDFGTGYSSLSYLQQYPFDEIKVDQAFVFHLLDDAFCRNIVETVMMLSRALGAEVMAEGIESAEVAEKLVAMGCRFGQGFHYSMPLEAEDFRWLLEQRSRLPLKTQISG